MFCPIMMKWTNQLAFREDDRIICTSTSTLVLCQMHLIVSCSSDDPTINCFPVEPV